jgi:hypothetical protein
VENRRNADLKDGEGDELLELGGELVPELALVQICQRGVPLAELRVRGAQRLQVLQRRSHVCESDRERERERKVCEIWLKIELCFVFGSFYFIFLVGKEKNRRESGGKSESGLPVPGFTWEHHIKLCKI